MAVRPRPTLHPAGPAPRTWRRRHGGRGGARLTNPYFCRLVGIQRVWRRPRPAAAAAAATAPGARTATALRTGAPGPFRHVPANFARPRAPRRQLYAPAHTASRGHLLRPATTPPCAPLPAPPRPLPLAAPSAHDRLTATEGAGLKVSTLSRAQAGCACAHFPGAVSQHRLGVRFFWCVLFFKSF